MSSIYLDLTSRFGSAFGFFAKNTIPRVVKHNPYRFDQYTDDDPEFEDITLSYEDVVLNFAAMPFVAKTKEPFHVPLTKNEAPDLSNIVAPPPLIAFSRSKKLITTDLNGENAEVVERWGTDAYEIRMRGILVDMENHNYPSDLVRMLHQFFAYNNVIDVSGTQFFEKDISYLYVKDFEVNGVEGFEDTVQFTLNAKATKDVNFTLLNPN